MLDRGKASDFQIHISAKLHGASEEGLTIPQASLLWPIFPEQHDGVPV